MADSALAVADLGLKVGDHVCAFYNTDTMRDDIIASYVADGLEAGDRCVCYIDDFAAVIDRIPPRLLTGPDAVLFRKADDAYLPEGEFSKEAHIRRLEDLAATTLNDGYDLLRLLGDATFVVRNEVDPKEWFAYEAEVNNFAPRYPQFLMCLYDLNEIDGALVVYVLKTHPRILLNGMVIQNPYYIPPGEFLGTL